MCNSRLNLNRAESIDISEEVAIDLKLKEFYVYQRKKIPGRRTLHMQIQ